MGSAGLVPGVEVLDCAQENSGEHVSFEDRAMVNSVRCHGQFCQVLWSFVSDAVVSAVRCCGQCSQVWGSVLSGVGCGTFTGLWSVLSGAVVSPVQGWLWWGLTQPLPIPYCPWRPLLSRTGEQDPGLCPRGSSPGLP